MDSWQDWVHLPSKTIKNLLEMNGIHMCSFIKISPLATDLLGNKQKYTLEQGWIKFGDSNI